MNNNVGESQNARFNTNLLIQEVRPNRSEIIGKTKYDNKREEAQKLMANLCKKTKLDPLREINDLK